MNDIHLSVVLVVIVILYGTKTVVWALKPHVKSRFWLTTIAFIIISLLLLIVTARRVSAQDVPVHYGLPAPDYRILVDTLSPGWRAITECDAAGNARVVLDDDTYADTAELGLTVIHEHIHVLQAYFHPGGCRAFAERYRVDGKFRYLTELEAYCTSLVFRRESDKADELDWMVTLFWGRSQGLDPVFITFLSRSETEAHIRSQCARVERIVIAYLLRRET